MSAPTPAPGDDRPREGYYPDPSIPGYVRYWNGASWVPGTSRPAPSDGRPLTRPSGGSVPSVEETGPHFFDEDPVPADPHGGRPEPAPAWGADRAHQSGFGGDQDRRVSWGAPQGADPRTPSSPAPPAPAQPEGRSTSTDGTATIPPAEPEDGGAPAGDAVPGGTFVFRRPTPGPGAAPSGGPGFVPDEGTVTFRPPAARTGGQDTAPAAPFAPGAQGPTPAPASPAAAGFPEQAGARTPGQVPSAAAGAAPAKPGFGAGKAAADRAAASPPAAAPAPHSAPAPQTGPA
ncbi:DUF2510 domain-containing protein, partial [Streptomyces hilarionis]|uniref:DUF2510 domain-containing protein n=1 Tax=Streptomyces hilarionis TaxID=2839954 RepID=UPI002119D92E